MVFKDVLLLECFFWRLLLYDIIFGLSELIMGLLEFKFKLKLLLLVFCVVWYLFIWEMLEFIDFEYDCIWRLNVEFVFFFFK